YSAFALFFKIPEINAYVESNRHFLQEEYSSVVDTLRKYNHEKMPRVVQYQLATDYVVNESLKEEQRQNVRNTITLQSDRKYFLYWIAMGRGNYQEAIDTARLLEDRDLIIYGLLNLRERGKPEQSRRGSGREEKLAESEREVDEGHKQMEEVRRQGEEEEQTGTDENERQEGLANENSSDDNEDENGDASDSETKQR